MKKHRNKVKQAAAIAWYRPEQWQLLCEFSVDPEELEATHAEWLAAAEKAASQLEELGVLVVKVDVDVEELMSWCREEGLKLDGNARASFAQHKLQQAKAKH